MWHIHKWGKWSTLAKTDIMKRHPYTQRVAIIGYMFIQSRTCEKCGKVQYDEKRIEAD